MKQHRLHAPPLRLLAGLLLALGSAQASAAALGSLATSMGLFAALAALRALKAWPAGLPGAWGPTSGGAAIVLCGGAAYLWRARRRLLPLAPACVCAPAPPSALPPGFDRSQVLDAARRHFVQMQAAWDAGDLGALRALTVPDLLEELCGQLPQHGMQPNRTDVVSLHAELLGFDDLGSAYLASIEFSGMIREASHTGPVPFRELWMLAQSKDGPPAWRLARQQALL
jgi:hypothetical protein